MWREKVRSGLRCTYGTAAAVHFIDQYRDVVRVGELRNAVAEVEDMAGVIAVGINDATGFTADAFWRAVQRTGIEVAL